MRSSQRYNAIRLDQEKGLPTAVQKPPYHSTLIPGTSTRGIEIAEQAHDAVRTATQSLPTAL